MPIYSIRGIDVDFPFEAYESQIVYMDRVIESLQNKCHALLESPTGTGKTLCLLCATLAWRRSLGCFSTCNDRKNSELPCTDSDELLPQSLKKFPTIVYASRTHSQLRQVIKELKRCIYRPKMVVLGSRDQLCINEEVKSLRGKALASACHHLCKKRSKRSCHYYSERRNRLEFLKLNPHIGEEPVDIEDLVKIGKGFRRCPYYITRDLHKEVDIIFAPYNYLISHQYRKYLKINWLSSVLIFDEAHNLESLCAEAASFDLPSALLSACISEAQECVKLAATRKNPSNEVPVNPENFVILKVHLLMLQELISKVPIPNKDEGFTKPGPYIYEMLKSLNITHETALTLTDTIKDAAELLEEEKQQTASKLEIFADILNLIFRENERKHANAYRVHVQELEQNSTDFIKGKVSRTFSWWCFSPGITMLDIAKLGVGSMILTSGTLSPMDSLAQELKLDFPVLLENPHVIDSNQLWAGVVSTGPSRCVLNSSYRNRDVPEYKQELGNVIVNFSRVVPDGLLIFFPSYYLMDCCISFWRTECDRNSMTIWERICKLKKPVIEPKDSSLFPAAMQDFYAKLQDRSTSGAVFFAVCRGKVSEGLDFADGAGRAVVITGLPYANVTDPWVKLKREFMDEQSQLADVKVPRLLSGNMWYIQDATRAVNQAIGRVIRHRHDYGAIIFCDDRFESPFLQSKISLWIRPNIKCYSRYGEIISDLARFFRTERSNFQTERLTLTEQENNIVSSLLPMEATKGGSTLASGDSNVKNVGVVAQYELSRLEAFPLANWAPSLELDENNVKWKGLTILKRTGKLPHTVKREVMQKKRCEVVVLECDDCEKQSCETEVIASSTCFSTMGQIKKRKVSESQGSAPSSAKGNGDGDKKKERGSAFLSQVKEKLNAEEYNKFIGCMQAFKKKESKIANVMQLIVQLFGGTERDHLLMGFKDFIPVRYRSTYEECMRKSKREG